MPNSIFTPAPYTPILPIPGPYFPSLPLQMMPQRLLDGMINNYGVRLGWMKSHQCPCTYGSEIAGSPNPNCNTCNGRGYFWDPYSSIFIGLITFLHGLGASPDESGTEIDTKYGQVQKAEPTLTIPYSSQEQWLNVSTMDAFVECDSIARYNTILVQGETNILPYQQGLSVESVYVYDSTNQATYQLQDSQYIVSGAAVSIVGFPDTTAYMVEYSACPVYLAFRPAGGAPHNRPFAGGTGQIPKRYRIVSLDIWTRARNQYAGDTLSAGAAPLGTGGSGNFGVALGPQSASPQAIL